MDRAYLEEK